MPITISIVEDNRGTRESVAALLGEAGGMKCLSLYPSAEDALTGIPADKPDVALVDINLPGMNGIQCVARLKALMPRLQILMLTRYEESDMIFDALRAGASGYLLKKTMPTELLAAIEQVHAGGAPMSMKIARSVVAYFHQAAQTSSAMETLSVREEEILKLLATGYSYKEMAEQLFISIDTVRSHIKHIYEKLHVRSRAEAALKFFGKT